MTAAGVAVVIPARNEARTIAEVVADARADCTRVIVVDDASTDGTAAIATAYGADVVRLGSRAGYGQAVLAGFRYLLPQHRGEIVTLDGDGAHDPSEIRGLVAAHRAVVAELTIGDRFSVYDKYVPSSKRWSNHLAAQLCRNACGVALTDVACGFRAYGTAVASRLVSIGFGGGYAFAYQAIAEVVRGGGKVAAAPVSARYDASALNTTAADELLDLIVALSEMYPAADVPPYLRLFHEVASTAEAFTVRVGGESLCVHRVGDGFVFQAQIAAYASRVAGPVVTVPEPS